MKIEDDANYESYCFFLFVNTSSGSNQGYLLLRQEVSVHVVRSKEFSLSSQLTMRPNLLIVAMYLFTT